MSGTDVHPVPKGESQFLSDSRVQWIRQRTLLALNIPTDTFDG